MPAGSRRRIRFVAGIGDVEAAVGGESDAGGRVEAGAQAGAAIAGEAAVARAGDGGEDAGNVDTADAVIAGIGDVDGTRTIDSHGGGRVQLGRLT